MKKLNVLITGATGFLGACLAEELTQRSFHVRAFVRKQSNIVHLQSIRAEISFGDVRDIESLRAAMAGVDIVVHAAADTTGDVEGGQAITVKGTANAIQAAVDKKVKQFVYISSCSVYGVSDCEIGARIDESGPIERHPEARGPYSNAKFQAEQLVLNAMHDGPMNITCLRPGTIWGPGGETFTPMMGFKVGDKLVGIIENNGFFLPLVYRDNLISAITKCINHPEAFNKIFNVVDPEMVDKQRYTRKVLKPLFPAAWFIKVPYTALYAVVWCQEKLCGLLKRDAYLTRYRLISSQRPVVYDAGKIEREVGWSALVDFNQAAGEVVLNSRMSCRDRRFAERSDAQQLK